MPPKFATPGSSLMSVPRPAMFVAIVTLPLRPACATISASRSWNLALRTLCLMPRRFSSSPSISLTSTLILFNEYTITGLYFWGSGSLIQRNWSALDGTWYWVALIGFAFGLLAAPFHAALTDGGPLNILLTFAAAVVVLDLAESGHRVAAVGIFAAAGALVEYGWPGIGLVLAVRWLYVQPSWERAGWVLVATACLWPYNGSHAALWALPLVLLASGLAPSLPRLRWAFYWFYPLHLVAFWLLLRAW